MGTSSNFNRYVVPSDDGGWDVVKEGNRRPSVRATTRDEAVAAARRLTRRDGGGEVHVMNRSGKIVDPNKVPRAKRRTGVK